MAGHELLTFLAIALTAVVLAIPTGIILAGAALAADAGFSRYVLGAAGLGQVAMLVLTLLVAGLLPEGFLDILWVMSLIGWVMGLVAVLVLGVAAVAGRASGRASLGAAVVASALVGAGLVGDAIRAVSGLAGGIGLSTVREPVPLVVFQLFGIAVTAATVLITAVLLVLIGRRWRSGRPAVLLAAAITAGILLLSLLLFGLHGVFHGIPMLPGWLTLALSLAALLAMMALAAAGMFRRIGAGPTPGALGQGPAPGTPGQGTPQAPQAPDRTPPWT